MTEYPLDNTFAITTLDGSGNGQASIGPTRVRERWNIAIIQVQCSSNVKEATCNAYMGANPSSINSVGVTSTGSTGDTWQSPGNVPDLYPGQQVIAVWSGGDPGAIATLTVMGTRIVP